MCLIIGACAVLHNIAIMLNEPIDSCDDKINVVYGGPNQGQTIRNHIFHNFNDFL